MKSLMNELFEIATLLMIAIPAHSYGLRELNFNTGPRKIAYGSHRFTSSILELPNNEFVNSISGRLASMRPSNSLARLFASNNILGLCTCSSLAVFSSQIFLTYLYWKERQFLQKYPEMP